MNILNDEHHAISNEASSWSQHWQSLVALGRGKLDKLHSYAINSLSNCNYSLI